MESDKSPESGQKVEESNNPEEEREIVESSSSAGGSQAEPERPSSTNSGKSDEIKTEGSESELNLLSLSSPKIDPKKGNKINILLKAVGDAPILKQKLWAVDPEKQIASILQFIKSYLKGEANLFLFVNQAFAPSPDQTVKNLYECFGSDGKLVLHYSTTVAWG